ncbi:MAG: metal-dependent hydrolase [Planctomycetia bacterium]|jgi:L-ascorbate metabolism protein UlaG (beta-lactamase superfamily)
MPITLTWTGHATWLIDTGKGTLLIDPFFDECPTASMKARDVACDAILVTHGHFDHVADLVAIAKWTGAMVYCNWEIAQWLGKHGVQNVQPMNLGGSVAVPGGRAKMEIAHHSSSLPDGSYGGNPAGWLLDVGGVRVFIAGDTALFSDMERIGRPVQGRGLDVAVLPIGDLFTMGPDEAVEAVRLLKPKLALPSHYGTWPPIEQDAIAWARRVEAAGLAAAKAPAVGEPITIG